MSSTLLETLIPSITQTNAWQYLSAHAAQYKQYDLTEAFHQDPNRAKLMSFDACGMHFDYSKNLIDKRAVGVLGQLTQECQLKEAIAALFAGEQVNCTEGRAANHWLMRQLGQEQNNAPQAWQDQFDSMSLLATQIRAQKLWPAGKIKHVVNIGIGGSDLGPRTALQALQPYASKEIAVSFVSNVDGAQLTDVLAGLDPSETLFIVSSKSFTTDETLTNWRSAKKWLSGTVAHDNIMSHAIAVTANPNQAHANGFLPDQTLEFDESIGGRYSLWSPIGLPLMIAIGVDHFIDMLKGGRAMDDHYQSAQWSENLPVMMALIGLFYHNFLGAQSYAIIPYSYSLGLLPHYLQQLDMESNGKSVTKANLQVDYQTAPIIWGNPGTDGQHAFFQLLHQGTHLAPIDFILPVNSTSELAEHQRKLQANCLGQARALMLGQSSSTAAKSLTGNKPSNMLLMPKLSPYYFGALITAYEHKVYTQSVLWNINAFDQYGVELGKKVSKEMEKLIAERNTDKVDESTAKLLHKIFDMMS